MIGKVTVTSNGPIGRDVIDPTLEPPAIPLKFRRSIRCPTCAGMGFVLGDPKVGVPLAEDETRAYEPLACPMCHAERAVFVDIRRLREVRPWGP